jgi:sec-independent protein translocase protein TatB
VLLSSLVFGLGLGEIVIIVLVALVVIGPKDLPKMLRKVGRWAGKLRRMAADLRAQSGIDDALRSEGLADDLAEIRKLARGELDAVRREATIDLAGAGGATAAAASGSSSSSSSSSSGSSSSRRDDPYNGDFWVVRDREYPRDGADAYNALPDNAIVYAEGLPKSPLFRDALYLLGDENAELPPEPEPKIRPEIAEENAEDNDAIEPKPVPAEDAR